MDSNSYSVLGAAIIAATSATYATFITKRATRVVEERQTRADQRQTDLDAAQTLASQRQIRLDATKVDGAAYDRAQLFNQQVLDSLRAELNRTQQARAEDATNSQRRITDLEHQTVVMQTDIQVLRRALVDANVPIPITHIE